MEKKIYEFQTRDNHSEIKLALIATYPNMSKILIRLADQAGIYLYNKFVSFDEAAKFAKENEQYFDAILSRGATAAFIDRAVSIPVVPIPISPFDLIQSLSKLETENRSIAFFNYQRKIYGLDDIERMFRCRIHAYTFLNQKDIENGVEDCKAKDISTVIGGTVATSLACSMGMNGVEISSGEESVYRAFIETVKLVNLRKEETRKAARTSMAFESLSEGILIIDENNEIVLFNSALGRISKLDPPRVLGRKINEIGLPGRQDDSLARIFNETDLKALFKGEEKAENQIHNINRTTVTISHFPVRSENRIIGLVSTFNDVTKIVELENQIRHKLYTKGFVAKHTFRDIVTNPANEQMDALIKIAGIYAKSSATILIEGESGTGKELFAQSIHNESEFAKGPFVAVNCAAIPEHLLESEWFGYEAGAFTGARKQGKQGYFELAHNGTIFLDEVGAVPLQLQSRLLRAIEEREIMRVGGDKILPINVRIISATNEDLKRKVDNKEFRQDLYYRLNVLNLNIPALRDRKEDIELIANSILARKYRMNADDWELVKRIMPQLINCPWPGNIRQLTNVLERLSLFFGKKPDNSIKIDLLKNILDLEEKNEDDLVSLKVSLDQGLKTAVAELEEQIIELSLAKYNNNQQEVMKRLGIGRSTLWRKVSKDENPRGFNDET